MQDQSESSDCIRLGDVITLTLLSNLPNDPSDSDNRLWLFAEGFAEDSISLLKRSSLSRYHQCVFRVDSPSNKVTEKSSLFDESDPGYSPEPEQAYGQTLQYGSEFRLLHLHSSKYVSLSKDLGWTVALAAADGLADANCIVLPYTADKYAGDLVKYCDRFLVSFPDAQVKQYLSMRSDKSGERVLLCSSLKTNYLFQFLPYEQWQSANAGAVKYGMLLQFRHSVLGAYLAAVNRDEEDKRDKQSKRVPSPEPWCAVMTYANRANTYWMLERTATLTGGIVNKGVYYNLKHAISEQYLCPDFFLRDQPNPEFLFALVTPRRRDTITEIRLQDLVVISSNHGSVLVPERVTTLEQFWQNMVVSCQSLMTAQGSRFEVKLTHVLALGDTENQLFELIGVSKPLMVFFRKLQGFVPHLFTAKIILKKNKGNHPEEDRHRTFPLATRMISVILDTLKAEPSSQQLQVLQRITLDLQVPGRLFKILNVEKVDESCPALAEMCKNALELICRNNTEVSSQVADIFKVAILQAISYSRTKYKMLTRILVKVKCEADLHKAMINGICTKYRELALERVNLPDKTSLLRILTTLCKKADTKFEESRVEVFNSLFKDREVVTFNDDSSDGETRDGVELRVREEMFEQRVGADSDWQDFVVQILTLLSELCVRQSNDKAEEMKIFLTEKVGLTYNLLQHILSNKKLVFPIRTACVRLRGLLFFRRLAQEKIMEWPLMHGCWLYDQSLQSHVQMFTRKEDIRVGEEPIEDSKFHEFVFWMNKQERESPSLQNMREFLQYMEERLLCLKRMIVQGYGSDAYLVFLYQGLQDFAWAITQEAGKSDHWFALTISRAIQEENQGDLLRGLGKLFLRSLHLCKAIYKMLNRRKLMLALSGEENETGTMSVAAFVDHIIKKWVDINSRNDEKEQCLIGMDDFRISSQGTCKVYFEGVIKKRYDLVRTLSQLLLSQALVPRLAADKITEMLSKLYSEEVKASSSLITIQPMETLSYEKLREVIAFIQQDAAMPHIMIYKSEINKNLFMLWNTLELVKKSYPKLLRCFQKLLQKVEFSRTLSHLFAFCWKKASPETQTTFNFREDTTRLTLLLSHQYISHNPSNTKELLQILNWTHSFATYREFVWLMKELGLMEFVGLKNLGVVLQEALTCEEERKAEKLLEFLALFMIDKREEKRRKYQLVVGKILFKMLEDATVRKESTNQTFCRRSIALQRWIFFKNAGLRAIAANMRGSTIDSSFYCQLEDISVEEIKALLSPAQFTKTYGYDSVHPLPNEWDKTELWRKKQEELRKVAETSKVTEFEEQQLCLLIFESGDWSANLKTLLLIASEQLKARKNVRFVLNFICGVLKRCIKEQKMQAKTELLNLFWDCEVVELAYRVVQRETEIYDLLAALDILALLFELEIPFHRVRFVVFLKKDESAFDLFVAFQSVLSKYEIILAHSHKKRKSQGPSFDEASLFTDSSLSRVSSLMLKLIELANPDLKYHPHYKGLFRKAVGRYLQLFMACSDVCYVEFQDLMRVQSAVEETASLDMVTFLAEFVYEFSRMHADMLLEELDVATGALLTLSETISGPNLDNQLLVLRNEKFLIGVNKLLAFTQTRLVKPEAGKMTPEILIHCHAALLSLLLTLLEGDFEPVGSSGARQKHPKQVMAERLNWQQMLTGLEQLYKDFIEGRERQIKLEMPDRGIDYKVINLAIQQCILVKKLQDILNIEILKPNAQGLLPQYRVFYDQFIGYVEIQRDGAIIDLRFQVPYKCKYLTQMTSDSLISEAKRTSHKDKVDSFARKVEVSIEEMKHQILISRYSIKLLSQHWGLYGTLSFLLVAAINGCLLYFVTGYEDHHFEIEPEWVVEVILPLGVAQSCLKLGSIASYIFEYWPTIRMVLEQPQKCYLLPNFTTRRSFFIYSYLYILLSFTAIRYYQFYPLLLLDILYQAERLTTILKAVTLNFSQLLLTAVFAVLMVYIFSAYSLMFFQKYYKTKESMLCDNLRNCFSTTLNHGIRIGGGIGEAMTYPSIEDYYARMAFDLLFFIVIIIVLLNILFGIIIDTFGELRDKKRELDEDMNNVCFICGQNRSLIDVKGEGWAEHTKHFHNPVSYFAFLVHIFDLPKKDCNGLEKYVKELQEHDDSRYLPTSSRAIRLRS